MELVLDMSTDVNGEMTPDTFVVLFPLFCFLLSLNTEMQRFAYCVIRKEDCEGMLFSSPLGESRVAESRLILVVFCTLLDWLTWWLRHRWWDTYPVEGLGVYYLASIPCNYSGYSVIPLGSAWVSGPGFRSWGPVSSDSSFKASLGRGILEDSLRYHYFDRVKFSCVEIYECSSTRFSNLLGLWPSSCATKWIMCSKRTHGTEGKHAKYWCLILGPLNLSGICSVLYRLWSSPLVPIWVALLALPEVGLLGRRRGSPRCGSL